VAASAWISRSCDIVSLRQSRRAVLKEIGAICIAVSGVSAVWPRKALAAPTVTVAAPTLIHAQDCMATVLVLVSIAGASPGERYEASGNIMESDEPDGDPDICCELSPQPFSAGHGKTLELRLEGHARSADLGLVKGVGPASDEAFSPDLVELFARVWIRDLASGQRYGPWESPLRVAVASAAREWSQVRRFPGSELLTPRGRVNGGGEPLLPPLACAS
jgi:hypothetical protein